MIEVSTEVMKEKRFMIKLVREMPFIDEGDEMQFVWEIRSKRRVWDYDSLVVVEWDKRYQEPLK